MFPENYTLVHQFLENSADKKPLKIALVQGDLRASYQEINSKANQFANWLIDRGANPGDRIAILLENSLEYVIAYYGVLKSGAIAVPLNTGSKENEIESFFRILEPRFFITSAKYKKVLPLKAVEKNAKVIFIVKDESTDHSLFPEAIFWDSIVKENHFAGNLDRAIDPFAPASIIFTSGSTGGPKGVVLSHANIVANVRSICASMQIGCDDVQMVVLPFFYVMGKSLLNTHFAVGARIVINNTFAFPVTVLKQMIDEKVTSFSGVPSTYAYLLHRSPLAKYKKKLNSLRYCSQAGGAMSRRIKLELREILPKHTQIFIMYGATEASSRLTCLPPEDFASKTDSIGKAIDGVDLKVIGPTGVEAETGEQGELVASGANIMLGYWRDAEATRKALTPQGYRTGDIGYRDADGFFYVTGRIDAMLKVGGHRINPLEIEETLMSTGLLSEVCVLGVEDRILGNRLVALLSAKNGDADQQGFLRQFSEKLPKHKMPSFFEFLKTLPKHTNGKIDKERCMKIAATSLNRN